MPTWSLDKKPTWAPDAVATDRGWVDPVNGDILVSCKRLANAVSYVEQFGEGVSAKPTHRGGARKGAGRKTNAERAEIAKDKLESGEKITPAQAKALEKETGAEVDVKSIQKPKRTRKKAPAKKRGAKKGLLGAIKDTFTSDSADDE